MSGRQRKRLDARSWGEVMRRFDASSKTVSVFCEQEGLSPSSFYRWRGQMRTQPVRPSAESFIDLGRLSSAPGDVPTGTPRDAGRGVELRLELGAGVVLHIVRR